MNLFSMTGFASAEQNTENLTLTILLRAVNHRFLDINVRMPDELRALEYVLRERIAGRIRRGKIDCQVQLTHCNVAPQLDLNHEQLATLIATGRKIQALAPDATPLSVAELLRWPGILNAGDNLDGDALTAILLEVFERAWQEFAATRQREGEKLGAVLNQCCDAMEKLIARLQPRIPLVLNAYREKLATRLQEARLDPDENRLKQELALFATRIEVTEEIDRLQTHIAEVRRVLYGNAEDEKRSLSGQSGAPAGSRGKRLDFLAQELHRESNTLGAKSVDAEMSQCALELKVLVEQMREQVQNIE